ncbi:polysaccharide biosynthesis protein [Candidatus Methylopumilus universalis]|uniref:polysaccharide biosynthesis protein n=1 Tax=Candidatus Methylopumilus universalis TaxID=2588536 RepID=UPI001CB9AE4B|nr:nucleoside-diphosphate sugar epimerase/dehydratase [Candidatus Methylopumilus universalis]
MNNKNLQLLKKMLVFCHDAMASIIAWFFAYQLRFNFNVPGEQFTGFLQSLPYIVIIQILAFYFFDLYRGVWRFASLVDLKRIIFSVSISLVIFSVICLIIRPLFFVPRSVIIIDLLLLILIMGGSRFLYRLLKEHYIYMPFRLHGEPVIIIGSGQQAISLAKDLLLSPKWSVIGMVSDDKTLHGREISGFKILGGIGDLSKIQTQFNFSKAIFADNTLSVDYKRSILRDLEDFNMEIFTSPTADDLVSGRLSISQIRPIEVEDLLGRDVVKLDTTGMLNLIANQVILVTGAGGSIGSELCRQIVKFNPKIVICFDISEAALHQLEQELNSLSVNINVIYLVGDVKNKKRVDNILSIYRPALVFHAAAYKHVPLMEDHNVIEALNNNVLGTYVLAKACQEAQVNKFVFISTDKAVNPTNVMGASKRMAEMICQGLQEKKGTKFLTVRFGNVLGSSGSVIPKFRDQIKAGGPITVTHPDVTRYFMSIPEASQLVMQAGLVGIGGEIFVLEMGTPIKIFDLAKDMIRLSGLQKDEIKIEFIGLRPGEKLYEELLADNEHTLPTSHDKLRIAQARNFNSSLLPQLINWINTIENYDEDRIKEELVSWVSEYSRTPRQDESKFKKSQL